MERLDKFLCDSGIGTRSQVKLLIKGGRVTVDGKQIPRYIVRDNWDEADEGWYYELSDRTILVKCAKPQSEKFDIVVSTEKFDLIGMNED